MTAGHAFPEAIVTSLRLSPPAVVQKDGKRQWNWSEATGVQYCLFCNDRPRRRGEEPDPGAGGAVAAQQQ